MTEAESDKIIKEVKEVFDKIAYASSRAQLDSFLSYYDASPAFLHVSADGKMRSYEELKIICDEYYTSLKQQELLTIAEHYNVVDKNLVIISWTGNIAAAFKNGDVMNMNNYSVTNVFKKIDGNWKIIHSHESSLPPEIIKKQ